MSNYRKLRFLLIPIAVAVLCFGWEKWSSTVPQPLPHEPTATASHSNHFLSGSYYETSVPPEEAEYYLSADYRLWIPNGVTTIRGLIVKQHGCGDPAAETGLDHANDLQWQALAAKHKFALLGTNLPSGDQPCENWALMNYGSGNAFLKALNVFAEKSRHPELESVPWVLWGHSGGADWVAQMLQEYPERTIAMIGMRCGGFLFLGTNPTLASIPVLFALGETEPTAGECLELPQRVFSRYRKINAVWSLAVEADTGHESGDTRFLAIPYLDAIITARLAEQGNQLRPIEAAKGWLGNLTTHAIFPAEDYTENPLEAVWLPNEEVAGKWREYVTTGKVALTHKPAPPTDVRVTQNSATEAVITWHFTPDLENGLPSFRIYRNNSLIGTLEGQEHNFGDAAEPPNPILEFRDQKAKLNSVYTVAAFNVIGESTSELARLEVNRE